jgi:hypothetical protein
VVTLVEAQPASRATPRDNMKNVDFFITEDPFMPIGFLALRH